MSAWHVVAARRRIARRRARSAVQSAVCLRIVRGWPGPCDGPDLRVVSDGPEGTVWRCACARCARRDASIVALLDDAANAAGVWAPDLRTYVGRHVTAPALVEWLLTERLARVLRSARGAS